MTFKKCGHTVGVPDKPTPVQCPEYLDTDQWHQPLQGSTTASSTNRIHKCPRCLKNDGRKRGKGGKDEKNQDKDEDVGEKQTVIGSSSSAVKAY